MIRPIIFSAACCILFAACCVLHVVILYAASSTFYLLALRLRLRACLKQRHCRTCEAVVAVMSGPRAVGLPCRFAVAHGLDLERVGIVDHPDGPAPPAVTEHSALVRYGRSFYCIVISALPVCGCLRVSA